MTPPASPDSPGGAGERPVPFRLIADVLWRRRDTESFEICRIVELPSFLALQGSVLTVHDGEPLQVQYVVQCDASWATRAVHVHTTRGRDTRRLELRRDDDGCWWSGDQRLREFDGLVDVDLSITPATNTLPIRRLRIAPGQSAATDAVWIRIPDLAVERLAQTYTRTSEREYIYESRGGAFRAGLDVDAEGVVVRYGEFWERVAASAPDVAHNGNGA